MKSRKLLVVGLLSAIIGVLCAGSEAVIRGGAESAAGMISLNGQDGKAADDETPTPVKEGEKTARQKEHGRLYGRRYAKRKRIPDLVLEQGDLVIWGPISEPPGIPVPLHRVLALLTCDSDAVVVGEVKRKDSQLSEAETFIFTDYEVMVGEVLKNNPLSPITEGEEITVVRPGGAVSIKGRTARAHDPEVERLEVNRRYLLYLKHVPATGAYRPADHPAFDDAFRFDGGKLVQISRKPLPVGRHKAADADSFLGEARVALNAPCAGGGR